MEDLLFDHEEQIEKLKEKLKAKDKKLRWVFFPTEEEEEGLSIIFSGN